MSNAPEPSARPPRAHPRVARLLRMLRRILAGALAAAAIWALVGLPVFVFPRIDAPEPVDVIFVIGPPVGARTQLAERLVADGYASTVLVSVGAS